MPKHPPRPNLGMIQAPNSYQGNINFLQLNCRSVRNKVGHFHSIIEFSEADFVFGTESWLDASVLSSEIFPPTFQVYRKDRLNQVGGGVFLAAKSIFTSSPEPKYEGDFEGVCCSIILHSGKKLYLFCVYRPPDGTEDYLNGFYSSVGLLFRDHPNAELVICGDFNLPDINWETFSISGNSASKILSQNFLEFLMSHSLDQVVTDITRVKTVGGNILDLVITNIPHKFSSLEVVDGISDHKAVQFSAAFHPQVIKQEKRWVKCFSAADWQSFQAFFQDNYTMFEAFSKDASTVNDVWDKFAQLYHLGVDKFIPKKLVSASRDAPWYTGEVKRALRSQRLLRNRYKRTKLQTDLEKYNIARSEAKQLIISSFKFYKSEKLGDHLKHNPRVFWKFVNDSRKGDSSVPTLKCLDGSTATSSIEKAEILNTQFKGVFQSESVSDLPIFPSQVLQDVSSISVSIPGVYKQLMELDPHKCQGPDEVSPYVLKKLATEIAPFLVCIFQLSLDLGELPAAWKSANVCPVPKGGSKSDPGNYRPISLTSIVVKLLEHIVFSHTMKHLAANHVINDAQHGFLQGRSCESQLVLLTHELQKSLDTGKQSDLVFLDFRKAFDTVPHQRLLLKAKGYGICSQALIWIGSFLNQRKQRVVVSGAASEWVGVTSGVPQGSVLGPLLFLLYINDICTIVSSRIKLYADDTMIYREIECEQDSLALQEDLVAIDRWCKIWHLQLNASKCSVMHLTRKLTPFQQVYRISDNVLTVVDKYKYLGLTVTPKLTWKHHIQLMTGKANARLRFVQRVLKGCPQQVKSIAYFSLVRPLLEYCCTIWDPHEVGLIQEIEMVQRRAARFVTNSYGRFDSVTAILASLGWETLEHRRNHQRIILLSRILRGDCRIDVGNIVEHVERRGRYGHSKKIRELQCSANSYFHSFFPKVFRSWNTLSEKEVQSLLDVV
jgi:hypothetical protein